MKMTQSIEEFRQLQQEQKERYADAAAASVAAGAVQAPTGRGQWAGAGIGTGAAVGAGSHHLGLITVGVMAASWRIRRFVGWTGLICSGVGLFCGMIAIPAHVDAVLLVGEMLGFLGAVCLVLWTLATFFAWIGRIIGEDTGLIEKRANYNDHDPELDRAPSRRYRRKRALSNQALDQSGPW
jgi:hypothetical protein